MTFQNILININLKNQGDLMKNLFTIALALLSFHSISMEVSTTNFFTEAIKKEISDEVTDYVKDFYPAMMDCDVKEVKTSFDTVPKSFDDSAEVSVEFKCGNDLEWTQGESCEIVYDKTAEYWLVDYCDM